MLSVFLVSGVSKCYFPLHQPLSIACQSVSIFVLPSCTCAVELHPLLRAHSADNERGQWLFCCRSPGGGKFLSLRKSQSISFTLYLGLLYCGCQLPGDKSPRPIFYKWTGAHGRCNFLTHVWPMRLWAKCFSLSCWLCVCWKEAHPWAQGSWEALFQPRPRAPLHLSCTKYECSRDHCFRFT